jgi:hypothetical protein
MTRRVVQIAPCRNGTRGLCERPAALGVEVFIVGTSIAAKGTRGHGPVPVATTFPIGVERIYPTLASRNHYR